MSTFDTDVTRRVSWWIMLTGHRTVLAGGISAGVALLTWLLIKFHVVYVGPGSMLGTTLASGVVSGLLTLITVALSINQLILSRVFGSPGELADQLDGTMDFRRRVEEAVGVSSTPTDPGEFIDLVAGALEREAADLDRFFDARGSAIDDSVIRECRDYTAGLVDYANHLNQVEGGDSTVRVLRVSLGSEYADFLEETHRLRNRYGEQLSEETCDRLDNLLELLKSVAIIRQFFKTVALQQSLSTLSRRLIYTGLAALLTAFFLAQVYPNSSDLQTTLSAGQLTWVASLAIGVIISPLAVLISYLLRSATIGLYTVSVGPFVPPEERIPSP